MPSARLFTVKGRVQGVFFRDSTRRIAESLEITGYAINLPNGDVEVLACGGRAAIAELAAWLRGLATSEIDVLEGSPCLPPEASGFAGWTRRIAEATAIGPSPRVPCPALDGPGLARGIKGRKWSQLRAFVPVALAARRPGTKTLIDWCAGKGHLGRTLSALTDLPAVLVERQPKLCASGAELAERAGVRCAVSQSDVLRAPAPKELDSNALAVALHACGVLTDRLLEQAVACGAGVVAAMCCYHALDGATRYDPLSTRGRASGLTLEQHEVRLAVLDEVVAPERKRAGRRREMAYRLALDLLLREASGQDRYTPLGPFAPEEARLPFEAFCRSVTERLGLSLARFDAQVAERAGVDRARHVRALALVRGLFRRPLELWLVLDRALFLAERGRAVSVGTFCDRALTPRDLAIVSPAP